MPNYLGQHFLKNASIARTIIDAAEIKTGDTIVEIGPGRGALTVQLAEKCARIGARLIAIEKDAGLAEKLATALKPHSKNTTIICGDALTTLRSPSFQNKLRPPFTIIGNIPYYITGHLFRLIGELNHKPERCIVMVQKEVAERIAAGPPKMNRLAASVQFWATPKIIVRAPKEDFSPQPKVDSAVVMLTANPHTDDSQAYYTTVRSLFAQPRKTILNNLSASAIGRSFSKEEVASRLAGLGITSELRPQDLTIDNINEIAKIF